MAQRFGRTYAWLDDQVRREYTKLVQRNERDGVSRYKLADMYGWQSFWSGYISYLFGGAVLPPPMYFSYGTGFASLDATDAIRNCTEPQLGSDIAGDDAAMVPPNIDLFRKVAYTTRLGLLVAGAGLVGKSLVDICDYVIAGDMHALLEAGFCLSSGTAFITLASSMYVKDADPKLLEKDPAWKQAYGWLRSRVQSLLPAPSPIPAPATYHALG
jgi:hypothetical protein